MRRNTPSPVFDLLVSGHFREGRDYTNWRERGTDDWLLIGTVEGAGRFGHADGEFTVEPGELVLIQPGCTHDYGTADPPGQWDLLWVHFRPYPHWHSWLDWPGETRGIRRMKLFEQEARTTVFQIFRQVHSLATGAMRRREEFAMNALERTLLVCDLHQPRSRGLDPRIQKAMDHLCRSYSRRLTLQDLSREVGLSPSRLSHLFRAQVGTTPHQFLEQQRIERARQLLELTSRTVEAIAYDVGYESPFHFSARFKRHTGVSPRAFRNRGNE